MSKTSILHIIDSLPVGGAEKLLISTINSLPDYDHHLIYLGGSDELAKELSSDCKINRLHSSPTSRWHIPRFAYLVNKYIRHHNIGIVHSHLVMATLVARLACPTDVKLFNSIHSLVGSRFFGNGKKGLRLLEKMTYKKRHHVIAVSEEVLQDYDNYIGIKGAYNILPNFVDDQYFKHEYKKTAFAETFRMVTVGNLKAAKNYTYLVEAFKQLPRTIQLDIYGEGSLRDELQSAIDKNSLNIRLCGATNNVHEVLNSYDLFVMSSSFEGHPLALLEAMAMGMPAAVSDIPVFREAVGGNGIFFDLNDTNDFVKKITAIANHQVDLDEYAKYNFKLARKEATKERYIRSLTRIYGSQEKNSGLVNGKFAYSIN
ncbi:MAG: glycosyltransferase [Bacteroidota bacterium]